MTLTLQQARDQRKRNAQIEEKEFLFGAIDEALGKLFGQVEVEEAKKDQLRRVIWYYDEFSDPFAKCVRDFMEEFGPGQTEQICGTLSDLIRAYGRGEPISLSDDTGPPEIDDDLAALLRSISPEAIDKFQTEVANARR